VRRANAIRLSIACALLCAATPAFGARPCVPDTLKIVTVKGTIRFVRTSIRPIYTPDGKAIQDTAVTPNVIVADVDEDAALPDDDQEAAPTDETRKPRPQTDEQLQKAIQVLNSREAKSQS